MEYTAYITDGTKSKEDWALTFATKSDAEVYIHNLLFTSNCFGDYYGVIDEIPTNRQWIIDNKPILGDWRTEGF